MILKNINQTLREPLGYYFDSVRADGAFLVVAYSQKLLRTGTNIPLGTRWIHIWVNDQGREVIRTEDNFVPAAESLVTPPPPPPAPKRTWWDEFKEDVKILGMSLYGG
jgi:hypothetical protein